MAAVAWVAALAGDEISSTDVDSSSDSCFAGSYAGKCIRHAANIVVGTPTGMPTALESSSTLASSSRRGGSGCGLLRSRLHGGVSSSTGTGGRALLLGIDGVADEGFR